MTKQKLRENIIKISKMTLINVKNYQISISTSTADAKAKYFLYKACDQRLLDIDAIHKSIVTNGDMNDFN